MKENPKGYVRYDDSNFMISDYTHPDQRPKSIGIFRLWRDLGYAIGALLTGLIADRFGLVAPIFAIGLLTVASSMIVKFRMSCAPKKELTQKIEFGFSH